MIWCSVDQAAEEEAVRLVHCSRVCQEVVVAEVEHRSALLLLAYSAGVARFFPAKTVRLQMAEEAVPLVVLAGLLQGAEAEEDPLVMLRQDEKEVHWLLVERVAFRDLH
ncbi:polyketide synthase [Pseudozyma hubeiensis SY62]|uniref:Polyketide synthase n=1 Tax=Pseudozyma hubeiensis (strain SY62) TaxID=1305764 RepID=R9PCL5_PSEHS|nr:polyketide synthase [Pseudozyma hubeiensis SY62]GAC98972.1 polyketide synthase [Pseudozyma hubeiensis SY62]